MGLISKIKSVLGVSSNGQERSRERTGASATESEPEASSERAVKGVEPASDDRPPEAGTATSAGETESPSIGGTGDENGAGGDVDENGATGTEPAASTGEPVESIKGIGAAYAQRLADAGVDDVSDLARADPQELAAATDLGTGRVGKWIERAKARTE